MRKETVRQRIEKRVVELMANSTVKIPSKAYLGRREAARLTREFRVIQRYGTGVTGTIKALNTYQAKIDIVRTKHRSYFRVV